MPHRQVTRALEEEKVLLDANGRVFSATSDKDMLIGNRGFDAVPYKDFLVISDPDKYYEKTEALIDLPRCIEPLQSMSQLMMSPRSKSFG